MTRCNFSSAVSGNPSSPFSVGEGDDNISRFTFSSISSTHCSNNFNSGGTSSPSPIIASTTAGLIPRALALRSKFFRVKPFARSKFFIFKLSRKSFLCSVNFFSRSANAFSSSSSSSSYSRIRGGDSSPIVEYGENACKARRPFWCSVLPMRTNRRAHLPLARENIIAVVKKLIIYIYVLLFKFSKTLRAKAFLAFSQAMTWFLRI